MLQACQSVDVNLADDTLAGFPIVGPIARSHRWPAYGKEQKTVSVEHVCSRAWALRGTIVRRVQGVPIADNLRKIWDATIEDRDEGSCLGPFFSFDQVYLRLFSVVIGCLLKGLKLSKRIKLEGATVLPLT